MTRRRFDEDAYCFTFRATVLACDKADDGTWHALLDSTCFFPEGGGQGADRGTIGGVPVLDVQTHGADIIHTLSAPLKVGTEVMGEVDKNCRFRRMQQHTGEHILSGLAHSMYGCENVGFHLGDGEVTMDYDRPLTDDQIAMLEQAANRVVWENRRVTARYPSPEELDGMTYRSKLNLTENVRIVEIEGVDLCACCAPHVAYTGEIGQISILSYEKYKGGMRLFIACGSDAYTDMCGKRGQLRAISHLLSATMTGCDKAVQDLCDNCADLRRQIYALQKELLACRINAAVPEDGMILRFFEDSDPEAARRFVNACMPKCEKLCACFCGEGRFVIGSTEGGLLGLADELRARFSARCGGSKNMICGSLTAPREEIVACLSDFAP